MQENRIYSKNVTCFYYLHHIKQCKKYRPERKQAGMRARESPASASSKNAETGLTNSTTGALQKEQKLLLTSLVSSLVNNIASSQRTSMLSGVTAGQNLVANSQSNEPDGGQCQADCGVRVQA